MADGKFWSSARDDDDDDFKDDEEDDVFSSSEDEVETEKKEEKATSGPNRWARNDDDDDSDEEEKAAVRSRDEKANDLINKTITDIRGHMEKSDWNSIVKDFQKITKDISKLASVWAKLPGGVPSFYLEFLKELNEFCKSTYADKAKQKTLSKTNSKSLSAMQQRMKKYIVPFEQLLSPQTTPQVQEEKDEQVQKPEIKEGEEEEWTKESVYQKLEKLLALRGKKKYDRNEQISQLKELAEHAADEGQLLKILFHIVSAQFDLTNMTLYLQANAWKEVQKNIIRILDIFNAHPEYRLEKDDASVNSDGSYYSNYLINFLDRLEQEYVKSLQDLDGQKIKVYTERLRDEQLLVTTAERIQEFYEKFQVHVPQRSTIVRAALIRLKHMYCVVDLVKDGKENVQPNYPPKGLDDAVEALARLIYKNGDEKQKEIALLYHIYFLASQDQYYRARDLLLMSHLQDTIHSAEVPTQIIYNRAIAAVGLCAFRAGLFTEAHNCIAELYLNGRIKDLLAQGSSSRVEKAPEIERLEKRRQIPYHMHINVDLLEGVVLVSALLIEVPNMAANAFDVKRKVSSRAFKRLLDKRQPYTGTPENIKEIIVAATHALMEGDWRKTAELILDLKIWKFFKNSDTVKVLLRRRIQEEGLRTYLFTYSSHYDSLSLDQLSSMFELPRNSVHSIVSKMMINDELHASWDQPTSSIVMHKIEPTRLQSLALQFAEKAASFVENNERLYESRSGYHKHDKQSKWGQDWQNRNARFKRGQNQNPNQSQNIIQGQSQSQNPNQNQNQNQSNQRQNQRRGNKQQQVNKRGNKKY